MVTLSIYNMLVRRMREMDEQGGGKLQLLTQKGFDRVWEDLIFDPCTDVVTLMEVQNIDARWLPFMKGLLAFTRDLSFDATTEELRRVLSLAAKFWNDKPSEEAIDDAIQMVTGARFRIAGYFDFRMQVDQTVITEELEDFDPNVIDFPTQKLIGSNGEPTTATTFTINDLPTSVFQGGVFSGDKDVAFLVITNDPTDASNIGIYPVDSTTKGGTTLTLAGVGVPNGHGTAGVSWELYGFMDEYLTEVRLVDDGRGKLKYDQQTVAWTAGETVTGGTSGATGIIVVDENVGTSGELDLRTINGRFQDNEALTGSVGGAATAKGKLTEVVNRDLLDFLFNLARPFGERIDIVYINFLDQFTKPLDVDQWAITPTFGSVTVPSPGGVANFAAGARIIDEDAESENWGDQTVAWKIVADTSSSIIELMFFVTDASNHYFVRIDYSADTLELFRKVAAVDTQLGSTVSVPVIKEGVQDVIRVDALAEGSDTRIRVKLNGETKIDVADSPASFTKGKVGAFASASTFSLKLVEVNVLPTEIQRVGPTP